MNSKLVQVGTCNNGNSKILSLVQVHLTCVLAEHFISFIFIYLWLLIIALSCVLLYGSLYDVMSCHLFFPEIFCKIWK